ncbi:hypothetical protein F9C11_06545 [Amycolatopsis sp. VS8301801F10]|uniref:hypothetical protein n=1 Tax=Actinomycetes TaxID=1760 RepID=UPI0001B57BB2|nr:MULTISPECIES: hypothetical protein [Actinomycetes]ATY15811.1 hypothetical protein CU254_39605 [Amycolatopsis sp. AA4]EFL12129.1 predicted protein [Streptomyces sp. AA4]
MPEPILTAVATALATKAATGLYDLVKRKFSGNSKATAELEAATPDNPATVTALAERLDEVSRQDPEFGAALRTEFEVHQEARSGGVTNHVGTVAEGAKVVQLRDVQGNISL